MASQKILLYLDRSSLGEIKPGQPITREVAERWNESMEAPEHRARASIGSRCLRQFCLYLSHFDPRTCIVYRSYLPRRTRPAPYIYTREGSARNHGGGRKLGPPGSLRPVVVSTLIGLLYATGMRIGEALNLTLSDIDLRRRVIEIREGKFKKSRYVPYLPLHGAATCEPIWNAAKEPAFRPPPPPVFLNMHRHQAWTPRFRDGLS